MKIGMVGLGRMGAGMVRRLIKGKHRVVVFDRDPAQVRRLAAGGAAAAKTLEGLVGQLKAPRVIWLMVPAGNPTQQVIDRLVVLLQRGDIVVDGGNSFYKESIRRAEQLKRRGIRFVDAGTSGGVWGLEIGYCLMVGGEKAPVKHLEPVLKTLAPDKGCWHVGPSGAGHFVKMVHNGIEYGLLQAYAEGFALLNASPFRLDLPAIASLWSRGSVIRSWLLDLAERALKKDPRLSAVQGYVEDSGEGRWTVQEAIERAVPAPAITAALFARFRSRQREEFGDKLIAALRREFGGHAVRKKA